MDLYQHLEPPLRWRLMTIAKGCRLHGFGCLNHSWHQAHHVISQQNLRKHGKDEYLWDTRNGMGLCESAHRAHDLAVARVPYERLLPENLAFAKELGLEYLLDRYYPKEKQVTEYNYEQIAETGGPKLTPVEHVILDVGSPVIDGPALAEKCPTCDRALPKPHRDEEEKVRKGWTIAVPVAELENGAEVLDSLLEECRHLFGHDEHKKVKYYTLSQALALVVQNGHKMAAEA